MLKMLSLAILSFFSATIFAVQLTTYNSMTCPSELYYSNKGDVISRDKKWIEMEKLPDLNSVKTGDLIQQKLFGQFPSGNPIEIELRQVTIGTVFALCIYSPKGGDKLIYLYSKGAFLPTNPSWNKFELGTIQYECGSLQGTITFHHCLFKPANEPSGTEIRQ